MVSDLNHKVGLQIWTLKKVPFSCYRIIDGDFALMIYLLQMSVMKGLKLCFSVWFLHWEQTWVSYKLLNSNRDIIQQADDTNQPWFYGEFVLDAKLLFGVLLMSSISDFDLHLEISYSWNVCQSFSLRLHNYYNLLVFFFF